MYLLGYPVACVWKKRGVPERKDGPTGLGPGLRSCPFLWEEPPGRKMKDRSTLKKRETCRGFSAQSRTRRRRDKNDQKTETIAWEASAREARDFGLLMAISSKGREQLL